MDLHLCLRDTPVAQRLQPFGGLRATACRIDDKVCAQCRGPLISARDDGHTSDIRVILAGQQLLDIYLIEEPGVGTFR